ncbi:MAG: gluconokinase [Saprospiraceae bacterium]|nr:gluconokinase [Saprospiraceae bacterium]MDZ4705477.1 gluconokinase [Saprospiraceae bacterium]
MTTPSAQLPKIIFVMGVSGSGKTTIGKLLSERSGLPFFDGDDFHSVENIEKMQSGKPLDDSDRLGWLHAINQAANAAAQQNGGIFACSALKISYRRLLENGIESRIAWVFLDGDFELIRQRLAQRKAHFMPPGLLKSQFEALERPEDAIIADLNRSPEAIVDQLMDVFSK